jgi:glycosyltransferase involved in cell wall biosynthesis
MNKLARLTLIIITKNEAHNISRCINSALKIVDEVIVFDSGSIDGTPEICRGLGAQVFETNWPGDGPQKNRALDKATGDWVLCLDADECLSPELSDEIFSEINAPGKNNIIAFSMPRSSMFCNQFMKHSGWWPDRIIRLFRNGEARFSEPLTHATVLAYGPIKKLKNPITHYAITNISQSLEKMNAYSSIGALSLQENGIQSSLTKSIFKGLWTFFRTYIIRLGFLDGKRGLMLAIVNAEGTYYKYIKLWLQSEKNDSL